MEQQNDNLRERLLSRLPQQENLPRFQEETASLMARHERALFWERWSAKIVLWMGIAVYFVAISAWARKLYPAQRVGLEVGAAFLLFTGAIQGVGYMISRSKVDILKEVKQVQFQVLELQAQRENTER